MNRLHNSINTFSLDGQIVDIVNEEIFPGEIYVVDGTITSIRRLKRARQHFLVPGLIDAHVHVESSMLPPSEFARLAVVHGTVSTVSDPHEIGNVLGVPGVNYMLDNARQTPLKFNFGAPSCVPATTFETGGAIIDVDGVQELLANPDIRYLAEMMNFPGVLGGDPQVMAKIAVAKQFNKPIDGHSPGLRGDAARRYINAGISTDHECFTIDEAREKLQYGMKIIIREGSAAKNFDTLIPLLDEYPGEIMLCSDDKHPDSLILGHINDLVVRALNLGINPIKVLRAATLNVVRHYGLHTGLLRVHDPADFIVVDNLNDFGILATYIDGQKVAASGDCLIPPVDAVITNNFNCREVDIDDIRISARSRQIRVIRALPGQIVTEEAIFPATIQEGIAGSDPDRDLLKLVVVNRYSPIAPAAAFVTGLGLKKGAFASSVGHDCHNIIAAGVDDADIVTAVNQIIKNSGGLSYACGCESAVLPLPIAGLMTTLSGVRAAQEYKRLDELIKDSGSTLPAPYMTLSFLPLLVIPELKLSDQGLFNGNTFEFTDLFI